MIDINDNIQLQIAISRARGMRAPVVRELFERIGSLRDFFSMTQAELHNLSGFFSETFSDQYRHEILEAASKEANYTRLHNIDTLFLDCEKYPERLSACEDAPVVLYKLGSCNLSPKYSIGIVGTRHATSYGVDFTTKLVSDLAEKLENPLIISGLAYGIDVAAHKAALKANIPTVGVVAHGLNMIYPADHRDIAARMLKSGGAIVTEYPSDTRIHRSNFLERNRIVAGLCDCLVVVESDYRGGSLSTARIANQYSREVFALPGRITDKYSNGTNRLIANHNASLITCADDIIEQMGWTPKENKVNEHPTLFRAITSEEQLLLDFILANPDATINDMCVHLGKPYSLLSNTLCQMEMDDIIITVPGGRYAVAIK